MQNSNLKPRFVEWLANAAFIGVMLLIFLSFISYGLGERQTPDIQLEIDRLLREYDTSLQFERINGTTEDVFDPETGTTTKMLAGNSQVKMEELWAETAAQIESLQARPESERIQATAILSTVSEGELTYIGREGTAFDPSAELEVYSDIKFNYQLDIHSGEIIKVWLKDQTNFSAGVPFSTDQLLVLALEIQSRYAPNLRLDLLNLQVLNKGEVYFFRWEDSSRRLPDGNTPFVQVAITLSGDFLNFENTVPFSVD